MSENPFDATGSSESSQPQSNLDPSKTVSQERTIRSMGIRRSLALVLIGIVGISVYPLRMAAKSFDGGAANLVTLLLGLLFLGGLWLWFVSFRRIGGKQRLLVAILPFAAVAFGLSMFRFDGFSGDMRPTFRSRFEKNQVVVAPSEIPADVLKVRDETFTQYLGDERTGRINPVDLATDWETNPPTILWKHKIGEGWSGFASDGVLAVTQEQIGDSEQVSAYSLATGELQWSHAYTGRHANPMGGIGPRATPTIVGGKVYTQGATGVICCVSLSDGSLIWTEDTFATHQAKQETVETKVSWGRSGSPLVENGKVFVAYGLPVDQPKALAAFDAQTGEPLWAEGDYQISYASPCLMQFGGVQQIVCVHENFACGHDQESGAVLWSIPWESQSNAGAANSQPIQLDGDRFLLSKGYGLGAAIVEISTDGSTWTANVDVQMQNVLRTKFANPVFYEGAIYGLSEGILECVDAKTLKRNWKRGRYGHGQFVIAGDNILLSAEDGRLVLLKARADQYEELGSIQVLSGTTWNPITVVGNVVLMRNSFEVACVLLDSSEAGESTTPSVSNVTTGEQEADGEAAGNSEVAE